ncbi:MAG: hypothetical protein ACO3A4_07520 [Silvanigrellaceae bacterium]
MNHSRLMWGLGGIAALLATSGALGVKLAIARVTLKVRVTDNAGPLSGVWVSFEDRDVLVTDHNGTVEIQGRRWELDNALLTVSDPSAEILHLSQNRRASVSWNPWKKSSEMEIRLPVLDAESTAQASQGRGDSAIDLPMDGQLTAQSPDEVQLQPGPLREEELSSSEETAGPGEVNPGESMKGAATHKIRFDMNCRISGLPGFICGVVSNSERPPSIAAGNVPSWLSFPDELLGQSALPNVDKEIATMPLEAVPSNEESGRRIATVFKTGKVKIQVMSAGEPISGATLYMSRMKDNRVHELGMTGSDGILESKYPKEFFGESVTVFQECCAPRSFPVKFSAKVEEPLRFELSPGTGTAALVQREAYGFLRKVEQSELHSAGGKLTVSGLDGFAIYNSTKTPNQSATSVRIRGAKPSEYRFAADGAGVPSVAPQTFLVSSEQNYLPALAIVERADGKSFQGVLQNSELRRWRRDFIARLMQLQSVRPVVSIESEARIAAAGESLPDIVARGWSETHLAGEWDLMLSIQYDEKNGEVRLSGLDAFGREFFESRQALMKTSPQLAPESAARKTFDAWLATVPFEGGVFEQRENNVVLTFSDARQFGIKPGTTFAIYQESSDPGQNQRLSELAALAKVNDSTGEGRVSATVTHWNLKNRKTGILPDVVRVVKVSEETYLRESKRKGLSRNLLSRKDAIFARPL